MAIEKISEWGFKALHEHCVAGIPAGSTESDFVTELKQTVGKKGESKALAYEFHIVSHRLASTFINVEEEEPGLSGHVLLRSRRKAVGLMLPLTFKRRGARAKMHKAKLTVNGSFFALVAPVNGAARPDWRFEPGVTDADKAVARGAMGRRLLRIAAQRNGKMHVSMKKEARLCA